jgi:hypothetical protein
MVLRAGFLKKLRLYIELIIYDKNRRKITGPQCVKKVWSPFGHASYIHCAENFYLTYSRYNKNVAR